MPSLLPHAAHRHPLAFEAWRLETLNRPVRSRVGLRVFNDAARTNYHDARRAIVLQADMLMFHALVLACAHVLASRWFRNMWWLVATPR
jgi:hypothetical protein